MVQSRPDTGSVLRASIIALLVALAGTLGVVAARPEPARAAFPPHGVAVLRTSYTAWNGDRRRMVIALPSAALASAFTPRLPLVVALHGAAGHAQCDRWFGRQPLREWFAVACLDGQGVGTRGFSYGAPGQIADQLRVPDLVRAALPGAAIDYRHVVLVGQSMGGMEALLAADADPHRWQAVVALDAPTDLAAHYLQVEAAGGADRKSKAMRLECGGAPDQAEACYAARSPIDHLDRFGRSQVPLVMWWSRADPIAGSLDQSPAYVRALRARYPNHPMTLRVGGWAHGRAWWEDRSRWLEVALRLAGADR